MGEKKRKADAAESGRPAKKAQKNDKQTVSGAGASSKSRVKVTHLSSPDVAKPVVAFAPGITPPSEITFNAFSKTQPSSGRPTTDLLLQSSDHPTIDYVADESRTTDAAEKHIRHYIAAFDPASNRLQVMEAKKVTVRSRVRQPAAPDDDSQNEITPQTPSSRAALTQAFGTKKSKKAVVSMAENRLLARGGDAGDDPISTAILSSIKDEGDDLEDVTASRVNKPLPQPDLTATHILEVYPPSSLVFPGPARTTLSQMPLAYWRERVAAKKDVKSRYRYVANRVERLTNLHLEEPEDETLLHKMQILRYIQLLLEIHTFVGRLAARKRIPQPEDWPAKTTSDVSLSTAFLSKLVRHFFPDGTANAHSQTLFVTTILALTLHVPPPKFRPGEDVHVLVTEPTDISLDLALPPTEVAKLYRELGCKMEALTEAELARWGWEKVGKARTVLDDYGNKVTVPKPKFAKLKFPIVFPKISAGRPMKR